MRLYSACSIREVPTDVCDFAAQNDLTLRKVRTFKTGATLLQVWQASSILGIIKQVQYQSGATDAKFLVIPHTERVLPQHQDSMLEAVRKLLKYHKQGKQSRQGQRTLH